MAAFALHVAGVLLIWGGRGRVEPGEPAPLPVPVEVAVSLRQPPQLPGPGLVGAATPMPASEAPARASSWPSRRKRARPAPAVVSAAEPAASGLVVTSQEGGLAPGPPEQGSDPGVTEAGGLGATEGLAGDGGTGSRAGRRRALHLFGRVVSAGRRHGVGRQGVPYAPLHESTALRTYDFFPPLPASQWAGGRPYVIVLDVCVSGEGRVSDVGLLRPASRILDPVVLDAVRTWRYKPRLVDGRAGAFCHVLAIKYDPL